MHLNFRIIYVSRIDYQSDEERRTDLCRRKKQLLMDIESCKLEEVNLCCLKGKKSVNEDHEIEEIVFQVHAKHPAGVDPQFTRSDCLNDFLNRWKELFSPKPSPMITLHESDDFVARKKACHISHFYTDVSFGVLPHNGEFLKYASLPDNPCGSASSSTLGYANFFNDTRHLNIKYREFELVSSYNNIRNIFVNIHTFPREIFFDLANPPIVYKVELKKRRGAQFINHRAMPPRDWFDSDVYGRSNVMRVSLLCEREDVSDIIGKLHEACGEKPVHYAHMVSLSKSAPADVPLKVRHFGCDYLLTAIFQRNFTMAAQDDVARNISRWKDVCKDKQNARRLERVLALVLAAVDSGKMVDYWREIAVQYRHHSKATDENDDYQKYVVPENCRLIRRVSVTPTRLMLFAPEVMLSNRILRNFDPEYSLRVSFRYDDNTRLSFKAVHAEDEVLYSFW